MFRKILSVLVLCCCALCLGGCDNDTESLANNNLKIATGGKAGTYYPLGITLSDNLNKNIKMCNAKAIATNGSVQNIRLLHNKHVDLAFIQSDIAYYAAHGQEMFEGNPISDIRALAGLYPEVIQIVVRADSDIKTVKELKGKTVAVGATNSGTEANARQILAAADIEFSDLNVRYMDFGSASTALGEGKVDAAFITAGFPTPALEILSKKTDVRLLPISGELATRLIAAHPFYTKLNLSTSSYNTERNIPAVAVQCLLTATVRMTTEDAIKILTVLYNNPTSMRRSNTAANVIDKKNALVGMSITGHDGASRYFTKQ